MLLSELRIQESREQKPLTSGEMDSLSAPNSRNIGDRYKVGDIAFDNVGGMGSVPLNQEIIYRGFAAMMRPSDFLKLASSADRNEDATEIAKKLKFGVAIGTPFLQMDFDDNPFSAKITGHEGRARMTAILRLRGDDAIPVHFFCARGKRARDLSPRFFEALRSSGIKPEGKSDSIDIELDTIFWNGHSL